FGKLPAINRNDCPQSSESAIDHRDGGEGSWTGDALGLEVAHDELGNAGRGGLSREPGHGTKQDCQNEKAECQPASHGAVSPAQRSALALIWRLASMVRFENIRGSL